MFVFVTVLVHPKDGAHGFQLASMFPRLVQLVLETLWIRDGKPDQIFFLLCSLSAAL